LTAYIISFNRLTYLRNLCTELVKRGCKPVIIDNRSTYPPLLAWLNNCPYPVYTVNNSGSRSPWINNLVQGDHYIITDPDLDISGVPLDMVDVLMKGLEDNPTAVKCGLSLTIDDLPDNDYANGAKEYEKRFWVSKKGNYYNADVDTTLALYDSTRLQGNNFFHAVRVAPPYSCRHLPWYNTPENLTEEEKFYLNTITNDGFWCHEFKRKYYEGT
jgi:hypothetical protein